MGRRGRVQQTSQGRGALRWQRIDNRVRDDFSWVDSVPVLPPSDREPRRIFQCVKCHGEVYGPASFCQDCLYRT